MSTIPVWRKLSIGLVVVAIPAIAVNLPAGEPIKEELLCERAYRSLQIGSTLELLELELVRNELALTDTQKATLVSLEKEALESSDTIARDNPPVPPPRQAEKAAPTDSGEDSDGSVGSQEPTADSLRRAERQRKLCRELEAYDREFHEKLSAILHRDQLDRLGEIILQSVSFIQPGSDLVAVFPEEFDTELMRLWEISETQEHEIRSILLDVSEASEATCKGQCEGFPGLSECQVRAELHKRFQTLRPVIDQADRKVLAILTPKQRDAIARVKGKEIDFITLVEQIAQSQIETSEEIERRVQEPCPAPN